MNLPAPSYSLPEKAFFQGAYTTVRLEFLTFQHTGFGLAERAWHNEKFPRPKTICGGNSVPFVRNVTLIKILYKG